MVLRGRILATAVAVMTAGCSLVLDPSDLQENRSDAAPSDASMDGGGEDSGPGDSGPGDSGPADAGPEDAGPDAGSPDGGAPDAGPDGGDCTSPLTACAGGCFDLTSSDAHCGACDNTCEGGSYCSESACRPRVEQRIRIGSTGPDAIRSVAVDAAGSVYVTGAFSGTIDFGDGDRTAAGLQDAFVASYDAAGAFRWVRVFGGAADDIGTSLAVDAAIGVVAVGGFGGTVSYDGGSIVSAGASDLFVLALDPVDGSPRWTRTLGGAGDDQARRVATVPGRVYVAGRHEGGFDFASETLPGAGGADAVMLAFGADSTAATELWMIRMEGSETDIFDGVAASPTLACAGGFFGGTTDLDGLSLTSAGDLDGVVVCAAPDGTRSWHLPFANPGTDLVSQVAFGSDFLAITGTFEGSVMFGSTPLVSGGGWDSYVATASLTGSPAWAQTVSSGGDFDFPTHISVDGSNQVLLSAITGGSAVVGGASLSFAGESDWTLARWTRDGTLAWARSFGSSGVDEARGTAVSGSGVVWAVGEFQSTVDFDGTLVSAGDFDGALLRISD